MENEKVELSSDNSSFLMDIDFKGCYAKAFEEYAIGDVDFLTKTIINYHYSIEDVKTILKIMTVEDLQKLMNNQFCGITDGVFIEVDNEF